MELQGEDGSVIELSETLQKELGRGPGVYPHDRTVSRRQVRLQLSNKARSRLRVSVEVIGANPICLLHHSNGQVQIAKPGTHSSLEAGDKLSLSIQDPIFYTLQDLVGQSGKSSGVEAADEDEEGIAEAVARWQRRKQERLQMRTTQEGDKTLNPKPCQVEAEREQAEDIISEPELVSSQHDPPDKFELLIRTDEDDTDFVQKFGFVVEGAEFERYGKKAHDTSKWEWQIGPRPADDTDEDDEEERTHGNRSRNTSGSKINQTKTKRATHADDDDDDWRGDSEGEQIQLLSTGKRRKKEVQTRSHDLPTSSSKPKPVSTSAIKSKEQSKTRINSSSSKRKKEEEEEDEEDDDGEDLDGFLVDDVEEDDEPEAADDEDEFTDEDEDEEVEEEEIEKDKPLCQYGDKCFRKNKDHLAQFRH